MNDLRERLKISEERLKEVNEFILDLNNDLINKLIEIVEKYGGPEEINRKANEACKLKNLFARLKEEKSPYLADLEWLTEKRDLGAFVKLSDNRKKILGDAAESMSFNEEKAVTLEISALNFFPWLILQAKQAIEKKECLPGLLEYAICWSR